MWMQRLATIMLVILLLQGCKADGRMPQQPEISDPRTHREESVIPEPEVPVEIPAREESVPFQVEGYEKQRQKLERYLLQSENVLKEHYSDQFVYHEDKMRPWLNSVEVWGAGTEQQAICFLYQLSGIKDRGGLAPWVLMMDTGETDSFAYAGTGPRSENFQLGDIDGDGRDEILVHIDSGGNGGAGHYYSMIFRWEDDRLSTIYNSMLESGKIATHFTLSYEEEFLYHIENHKTGMDVRLVSSDTQFFFDETGKLKDIFEPKELKCNENFFDIHFADVDDDGTHEIITAECLSLFWHVESCFLLSVLRYNKGADTFEEEQSDIWYEEGTEMDEYLYSWYKKQSIE